tara:strand:+ start:1172 stop:1768 length:597 start_codon:yes stop_codon:yes gene_type:complete
MISIYKIKPLFQKTLMPILKLFHRLNVSPNMITIASIILSFLLLYFFWNAQENPIYFLFVSIGLLIRMMLNALDGMMARIYNMQSKFGEILNEVGDIVSDTAIYFSLILFVKVEIAIIFILLSIVNEFCGIMAKSLTGERRYDGPMGKSDRAFLVGLLCIGFYFFDYIFEIVNYIIIFASTLIVLSSYLRLANSLRNE